MRFAKLHGLGNDFVLLDLRGVPGARPPSPERALALCDRHRGIGADGILTLLDGDRLVIHNADGSVPEMCGNGARCAALWIATDRCTRRGEAEAGREIAVELPGGTLAIWRDVVTGQMRMRGPAELVYRGDLPG